MNLVNWKPPSSLSREGVSTFFSVKGQIVNVFQLCRPYSLCHNYSTLSLKQPQTICKQRVWLCFNKTLFIETGGIQICLKSVVCRHLFQKVKMASAYLCTSSLSFCFYWISSVYFNILWLLPYSTICEARNGSQATCMEAYLHWDPIRHHV